MVGDLAGWECRRCHAVPIELENGLSPDLKMGTCSNYQCPSRAPRKTKARNGIGYTTVVGKGLFVRRITT